MGEALRLITSHHLKTKKTTQTEQKIQANNSILVTLKLLS
jgi:hypothetical protein